MTIEIRNKLEILNGNKLLVPGCEPTSAFSSPTLAENRDCKASIVDLADAIQVLPGAKIVSWKNPLRRFLVLPDGPPPGPDKCSGNCVRTDWYALLREIGRPVEVPSTTNQTGQLSVDEICSAFPLKGVFG